MAGMNNYEKMFFGANNAIVGNVPPLIGASSIVN